MKRISIIGTGCSGKSTLAEEMGKLLSIAVYSADDYSQDPDERARILSQDHWIIEGDDLDSLEERIQASDTVIYLDYPITTSLKRSAQRSIERDGSLIKGITSPLSTKDILRVVESQEIKPALDKIVQRYKGEKKIFHFTEPAQKDAFMEAIG